MSSSDERHPWLPTISVSDFVTVKPSLKESGGTNFPIWKKQMLCLLESQQLVGFINGDIVNPKSSGVESKSRENLWRRRDRLVQGWILGSIGKDALDAVWELDTAREVWLGLEKVFECQEIQPENDDNAQEESGGTAQRGEGLSRYLPLYKASLSGDWEAAYINFFDKDEAETRAIINDNSETALHAAVSTGKANDFVKKLVELMSPEAVAIQDKLEWTSLHKAAIAGNTEAATTLVNRNPDLLYISDSTGNLPITLAAAFCKRDTLEYLISMSKPKVKNSPFEGKIGLGLLNCIIFAEWFDIALDLVKKYPDLALLRHDDTRACALSSICVKSNVFASRQSFSWWQNFIYHCIHLQEVELEAPVATSDIESVASAHKKCSSTFQIICGGARKFEPIIWKIIENLVPQVKVMRERKAKHKQALELVKYLCNRMQFLPENEAFIMFSDSIIQAAKNGISEIVEVIMDTYPRATFSLDPTGRNVFHIAVSYRFENVFNLIYNMSDRKYTLSDGIDHQRNNLMHICAKLAPLERLNLVPGAALQMQWELQWFQEMENSISPANRIDLNAENKTPQTIFTEEHRELKEKGERWMKDTANACTIAAALIATVVFAAAFTVPGGVASETGVPIFSQEFAFVLFAISDVVSLFTSITSLLMFLSILTSRYAEKDFLRVLPKRLSIGLLSLFVSITWLPSVPQCIL